MNLDELRAVQSKERQTDSLQNLRPSFYREVGDYISELEAERDRVAEEADDPFSSPEVGRLTDEIETARDVVEAVYERRMGKLVKQASLAAAGMPADADGLTAEEEELFDDLVDSIRANKARVLDVLAGETPTDDADATAVEPGSDAPVDAASADSTADAAADTRADSATADGSSRVSAADAMGDGTSSAGDTDPDPAAPEAADPHPPDRERGPDAGAESDGPATAAGGSPERDRTAGPPDAQSGADDAAGSDGGSSADSDSGSGATAAEDVERVTVRITRDVGSILGIDDREYTLASDDVVTLPERNAAPLVERDAAEPLE